MSISTGTSIGTYQIVGVLGTGGMGEVYRAWDPKLGREVAIKVLPEPFARDKARLRRFEQESRTLAALSHPSVVQIFDAGEHEGRAFLVMELVEGETLRRRLAAGPMPWREAAELVAAIADGLAAPHAKGIVHRDLKPENLMLTPHGHVKILDFGLAKLRERQDGTNDTTPVAGVPAFAGVLTDSGTVMGTADYMSPEQIRGVALDTRSDLFSLGVILWEMATGSHPFHRATPTQTMHAILTGQPEAAGGPERLPTPLRAILRACLAKDPSKRHRTALDLAEALRLAARTELGSRPTWERAQRSWMALRPRVLGVTLALALVAAGGGLYALRRNHPVPTAPKTRAPSVLALPTRVLGIQDSTYLTDAVPATLSTFLAGVEGLDTKVPPSSIQVEKWKGDLAQITEAYHADHLVVTTITKQKERLILNVQLVDTRTWKVRWGHQYEGSQSNYNDLVRDAAEAVARTLTREEGLTPTNVLPALVSDVELAMGEGKHFLYRYRAFYRQQDFEMAVAAFERAFRLDPRQADAAAELAVLHGWYSFHLGEAQAGFAERQLVETWARRALEIDPRCGMAWSCLGTAEVQGRRENPELAVAYAVKGVCLAPRKAQVHIALGSILAGPGAVGLFIAGGRRSMELDPLDLWGPGFVALGLAWIGRAEEAMPILERALLREPGHVFLNRGVKAYTLIRLGRLEEAEQILARSDRPISPEIRFWLAAIRGQAAGARALTRPLLAKWLGPKTRAIDIGNAVLFNTPYLVRVGLKDKAIRLLQKSLDMGSPPPLDWLLMDPDLQQLRDDPRFTRILKATRDGAAMVVRQLDQAKARGELPEYLLAPLEELRQQVAMAAR